MDGAYVKNLVYVNGNNVIYFDSFRAEHIYVKHNKYL